MVSPCSVQRCPMDPPQQLTRYWTPGRTWKLGLKTARHPYIGRRGFPDMPSGAQAAGQGAARRPQSAPREALALNVDHALLKRLPNECTR